MKVSEDISLLSLNSFGVDARAARLVEWSSADELPAVPFDGRWLALGGGNNMLFINDFNGALVKSAARSIDITGETPETLHVRAEAGVDWDEFVLWCTSRGLWGTENLSGIPGTVGAAPIQNIGAYGAEVKDIITSVECFAVETRTALTLASEHCGFGYRDSVFKGPLRGRVIVSAVNFALSKLPRPNLRYAALAEKVTDCGGIGGKVGGKAGGKVGAKVDGPTEPTEPTIETIRRAVIEIRNSKLPDPRTTGNAGSFFKNPVVPTALAHRIAALHPGMPLYPAGHAGSTGATDRSAPAPAGAPDTTKLSAGWLIEQAGWRGRTEGRVGIHPHQALIIINLGGATGTEIVDFARRIQADVKQKFGVDLTPEVNIIC